MTLAEFHARVAELFGNDVSFTVRVTVSTWSTGEQGIKWCAYADIGTRFVGTGDMRDPEEVLRELRDKLGHTTRELGAPPTVGGDT